MRIATHIQGSPHGIFCFRLVAPKALQETLDGQTEIRRSLHTGKLRKAMGMPRPLALPTCEYFSCLGVGMSNPEPIIADLLAKAQNDDLRELRAVRRIILSDDAKYGHDTQTDGSDPVENRRL